MKALSRHPLTIWKLCFAVRMALPACWKTSRRPATTLSKSSATYVEFFDICASADICLGEFQSAPAPDINDAMTSQDSDKRCVPSWKTVLEKALWTGLIGPPMVPIVFSLYTALVAILRHGFSGAASSVEPRSVLMWLLVVPGGSYLIGLLPAMLTGAILGRFLPRIVGLWHRVAFALLIGAITPIPVGLTWNNPPPMQSPTFAFMAIGAVTAVLTLPILHRRRQCDGTGRAHF
ncbi:hypothetical protein [Afifella aestuarii]|uniref:hypothetical protein n=1 Tax=Afifella aestuarii TaxID=1909496 RepID=UPI000FE3C298|nr:hypothetical protein [Afifella aestuarii]